MSYDPEIFSAPGQLGKLKKKGEGAESERTEAYNKEIFNTVADKHAEAYGFKKYQIGAEGLPQAVKEVAGQFSPLSQAAVGTKSALDNAALRAKQLTIGLSPEDVDMARANRALLGASPWAMGGNILGQAGALGPIAGSGFLSNAAVGAGQGLLGEPVLPGESGVGNAARGALFSVPATAGSRFLTGYPIVAPTRETKDLLSQGIVPTIGEAAQSRGGLIPSFFAKKEQEATSLPFIGDVIKNARQRANIEFNQAGFKKSLPPGESITDIGAEGVQQAKDALSKAYDKVYQGVQVLPDATLTQGLDAARVSASLPLNRMQLKQFDQTIDRNLWEKLPKNAPIEAGLVKMEMESKIGEAARTAYQQGDKALGDSLMNARGAVRDWLNRNVGPASADLPALNQARANLESIKKAVERAKSAGGNFTPAQLQQNTRPGTAMREFADTGQNVLGSTVPNSYTPDRMMMAASLSKQPGAAYFFGLPYLTASTAGPLLYSRPGSRFLLGDLTPGAMQNMSPLLGQAIRAYEMQQ